MEETMSIDSGINEYKNGKRFQIDTPPKGRIVRYINKNGYDYDRKHANKFLVEGKTYTVKEIYVGGSSSEVELEEFSNKKFNTVMFIDVVDVRNYAEIVIDRDKYAPTDSEIKFLESFNIPIKFRNAISNDFGDIVFVVHDVFNFELTDISDFYKPLIDFIKVKNYSEKEE
jgi:hypothetical protein